MNIVIFHSNKGGIPFKLMPEHINMVKEAFPEADIFVTEDGKDLIEQNTFADIVIGWDKQLSDDYLLKCTDLKWVNSLSAGVENLMRSKVIEIPNLIVTNTKGIHGTPISEHVVGFLLNHYRGLNKIYDNNKEKAYRKFMTDELSGKTACFVGAGAIGTTVAKRLKAFDVHVIGVKRTMISSDAFDEIVLSENLNEALNRTDIVVITAPLTSETYHMFDKERFSQFNSGTVFVNVGRGKIVDTEALMKASKEGIISAAMLDALDPEPLPEDHPLWDVENILISPHIAAQSPYYYDRAFTLFKENALRYKGNEKMFNLVNLFEKY